MNNFKKIIFVFLTVVVFFSGGNDVQAATVVFSGSESQLMSQYGSVIAQDMSANGGVYQGNAGIYAGQGGSTLDHICELIDPNAVASYYGSDDYASPGNNTIVKWNGSSWSKHGASSYNNHLRGNLTCTSYTPVVPAPVNYAAYCGDGIVNQTWEQCDGGNSCTNQCQDTTNNQCRDLILAKVNITSVSNETFTIEPEQQYGGGGGHGGVGGGGGSGGPYYKMYKAIVKTVHASVFGGNMTSNIFVGNSLNSMPQGTWFPLYFNGSYFNDSDISGYENVPGVAIQRTQGRITTMLHGSNTGGGLEHVQGNIELWNANVTTQSNNTSGNNRFENPTDGTMEVNPFRDEYWKSGGKSYFWSTVTAQDDSFYTNYSATTPICVLPPITPIATLTANPTTIDQGDNSLLTWTSTNTNSCTGTNFSTGGAISGSIIVSPNSTTNYGISCTGIGGTTNDSVTISVTPYPTPTATLIANPDSIDAGDPVQLTWSSANTTSCASTSFSTGGATSGSITVYPSSNITYNISCTGPGGTINDDDDVIVIQNPTAPTADLDLSPTTNIDPGDPVQLTWTSTNTNLCTGTNFSTGGATSGSITVYPFSNTTYSVECTGPGGSASDSDAAAVNSTTPTVDLTGDPTTIDQGDDTELAWSSTDTTSCIGTNFSTGSTTSGSIIISPSVTTTYDIECTGPGGTVNDSVTIIVNTGGGGNTPTCSLTADPHNIVHGGDTELTWTSTDATSVTIDNGVGSVSPVDGGDVDVSPNNTTTYTATFTGPGGSTTCSQEITVDSNPVCTSNCGGGGGPPFDPHVSLSVLDNPGEQPLAFVYLSQIPYTGFGAGPVVTSLFWMIVFALSAFIAHIMITRGVMQKLITNIVAQGATMYNNTTVKNTMNFTDTPTTDDTDEEMDDTPTPQPSTPVNLSGTLEARAHEENILVSSEGLNIVIGLGGGTEHGASEILETLLTRAKDTYPREDGWILLNTKRVHNLLPHTTVSNTQEEAEEEEEETTEDNVQAPTEDDKDSSEQIETNVLVIDFIKNMILKDVNKTFEILRDVKDITPPEFIAQVVVILDEVYKDRLEGYRNKNEEVSKLLSDWTDDSLEGVIEILAEAIDHSYKSNRIGVKVALTKMFKFLG